MSRFRSTIATVTACMLLSASATAMAAPVNPAEADNATGAASTDAATLPSISARVADRWYLDPRMSATPQPISEQPRDTWYLESRQAWN
jgi:hypothetical protein